MFVFKKIRTFNIQNRNLKFYPLNYKHSNFAKERFELTVIDYEPNEFNQKITLYRKKITSMWN